ncbi:MAG: hypothetical protein K2L72_02610 [Clostridia bacterium]|nr:hypothetical protein [Clostridia bacterium]
MKDFKSYSQSGGNGRQSGANGNAANNGGSANSGAGNMNGGNQSNVNQTVNMATMLAKAFEGKSETQILQTIIAQAEQGKRDGTLTNADLDNFYNALSPLLDGFKRQRLKAIIQKLKAI